MCGIVGCLALASDADPDQAWVASATQRIAHRGPDDEGFYSDHDVALGFRRLAIIDLSQGGHQPMRSPDGRYWMVFNGEIYNYVELGAELREQGVVLRSSCDSEVLLETYARVGKDVVHRLRGMFAFAIWDTQTRELFCARDQFGVLPFGPDDWLDPRRRPAGGGRHAARRDGDMLRFASERKALADPGELRDLDPDALRRYMSFEYVPPPGTLTPPVQVLAPGHAMIARPGRALDVYRYWRADLRPASAPSADT